MKSTSAKTMLGVIGNFGKAFDKRDVDDYGTSLLYTARALDGLKNVLVEGCGWTDKTIDFRNYIDHLIEMAEAGIGSDDEKNFSTKMVASAAIILVSVCLSMYDVGSFDFIDDLMPTTPSERGAESFPLQ